MCVAGAASATPTGLFLIPIADILKHREAFAFAGFSGTERNVDKGYSWFNAATVGLFDRVELGYDNDFRGTTTYNIKVQLFDNLPKLEGVAVSAGLVNCNGGYREPYFVARKEFKDFRLHAGYWNTMGCGRLMIGADFSIFGNGTGTIEFLSGPSSVTWGSVYLPIDAVPGLGVVLGVGVPSARSEGIQHSALLFYSFKI